MEEYMQFSSSDGSTVKPVTCGNHYKSASSENSQAVLSLRNLQLSEENNQLIRNNQAKKLISLKVSHFVTFPFLFPTRKAVSALKTQIHEEFQEIFCPILHANTSSGVQQYGLSPKLMTDQSSSCTLLFLSQAFGMWFPLSW
ncbi:hypothetical protein ILYODFUR_021194 [Ilyodon furcidens]|uniref:Uncharacterized protein n=1 Tax=Ilyodon furcidens TaxID=33524 RepID=A0ABV0U8H6_9TELE